MSTLITPPPPRSEDRRDAEALEALIEEARRRARRRRRAYAALALAAAAAGLLGFSVLDSSGGGPVLPRAKAGSALRSPTAGGGLRPAWRAEPSRRSPPTPSTRTRLRSNNLGRRLQERKRWSHVAIAESPVPGGPAGRNRHRARGPGDPVCRHRARRGQDDGRGSFLAVDGLGSCRKENEGRGLLAVPVAGRRGGLR